MREVEGVGRSSSVGEKQVDSGSVLELMLVGSDDALAVFCKRKGDPRMPPSEVSASKTW